MDAFAGNIAIRGSTFTTNVLKYASCDSAYYMDNNVNMATDNYPSFGTKSLLQIRSVISVVNH